LTREEAHVIEQCPFRQFIFADRVGMMNTLPPTEKVQQLVRITLQGVIGEAAKGLVIEIPIDPVNLTSGCLLDDAINGNGSVEKRVREGRERSWSSRLQQRLKLASSATLHEEAIGIVCRRHLYSTGRYSFCPETARKILCRARTTVIGVGIER
jgi:hypothetical protein